MRSQDVSGILTYIWTICLLPNCVPAQNSPLFLSPYIKDGKIGEAMMAAKVNINSILPNPFTSEYIESYSGYLTVNPTYNSNLFFWFFPAQDCTAEAPLVLFLVGGPGAPCSSEVFLNGPLEFDEGGNVNLREEGTSWTQNQSVIYLDSPVGSGFSFTEDPNGYSKSHEQIAENIYIAIVQFLQIFSTYRTRPFYIAGLSDGGSFATALGFKIDEENQNPNAVRIELKGLILLSPLLEPVIQSRLEHIHYIFGLYDEETTKILENLERVLAGLVKIKEFLLAAKLIDDMYGLNVNASSIFNQKTGYESIYEGLLNPKVPQKRLSPREFIQQREIRDAIHAGNLPFVSNSQTVVYALIQEIFTPVTPKLECLLRSGIYKIWIANGQFDLVVPSVNIDLVLNNLSWAEKNDFLSVDQTIWTVEGDIAGYFKEFRNFNHVLVRLAAHVIYFDAPKWTADLLRLFVRSSN